MKIDTQKMRVQADILKDLGQRDKWKLMKLAAEEIDRLRALIDRANKYGVSPQSIQEIERGV